MGKKSASPPPPVDPAATIEAQTQANTQAAIDNQRYSAVNQYTPYGSITYDRRADGTPRAVHVNLTPEAQAAFDTQMDITGQLSSMALDRVGMIPTDNFSLSGLPYDPRSYNTGNMPAFSPGALPYDPRTYGDIGMYVDDVTDAYFNQQMSRLAPAHAQQTDRLLQNLDDRGLPVGGQAFNSAVGEVMRGQTDQVQSAMNQAIAAGGQEASRRLGMEQNLRGTAWNEDTQTHGLQSQDWLTRLQTEQNLRGSALNEDLLERTQAFNEASAFLQGAPALTVPTAPATPQYNTNAADVLGANALGFNSSMQNYNANMQQQAGMWQGAANLAGTAMRLPFGGK